VHTGHVTFGSFGNLAKLTPEMLQLWARLLGAVPGARLLMKSFGLASEAVRRQLIEGFGAHGVAPDRLELVRPEEAFAGHLAAYRRVDIALDVFPYNGAATTCEALWMGVPVVTLCGGTHVSRVGASVLSSAGLPELAAASPEEYLQKAATLARDTGRIAALRGSMRERLRASALLDAPRFARSLERAYGDMWERWVESQETVEVTVPLPVVRASA
jgi:predicted O-linked N-acetylglucosamine transferase (SPINDLY family)